MSSHPYCAKTKHVFFPHTSLSNGSPSIRNWSASLSEFPTEIVFLCFTPFSLGPSILLVSSSRDVPIVSSAAPPAVPLSPFLTYRLLWPSLPWLSCLYNRAFLSDASLNFCLNFCQQKFPAGLLLAMVSKSSAKCKIVFVSNTNTAATIIQVYHLDTKRSRISKLESIVFSVIRIGMPTRILWTVLWCCALW